MLAPYFEGERTPNLPDATGSLHGITLANFTPANHARATVEGVACSLAHSLRALTDLGITARRVILVCGDARPKLSKTSSRRSSDSPSAFRNPESTSLTVPGRPEQQKLINARPTPNVLQRYRAAAAAF